MDNNIGVVKNWSLVAFALEKGKKVEVVPFVSNEGEHFKSVVFTNELGARTFVAFSSKMGELSPAEIVAKKDELQVVELTSGKYKLCKQGPFANGETVDLGL